MKYYPDIPIDSKLFKNDGIDVDLPRDKYSQILNKCNKLRLGFSFQDPILAT